MASTHAGPPPDAGTLRKRPRELEDTLNYFLYHPLSARLARLLQPTGITPNAVSILGMVSIWGAAACYFFLAWPQGAIFGLALHMLWHVVDGADGDLARLTGKSSPIGELVDGVCDYAGHAPLYVALAAMADDQIGLWAWPLSLLAAASHAAQTNHSETQRRSYLWWAYGVPWLKTHSAGEDVPHRKQAFAGIVSIPARFYLWASQSMTPNAHAVDLAVAEAAADPPRLARIRRLVRRSARRSLKVQKALGANPRTIVLGLCMIFAGPLAYFFSQIIVFNLILLVSVRHHNLVASRLGRRLDHMRRSKNASPHY